MSLKETVGDQRKGTHTRRLIQQKKTPTGTVAYRWGFNAAIISFMVSSPAGVLFCHLPFWTNAFAEIASIINTNKNRRPARAEADKTGEADDTAQ